MDGRTVKMIQFMRTFAPSEEKFMSVTELEKLREKGMVHHLVVHPTGETQPFIARVEQRSDDESKKELEEKTDTPQ